MKALYDYRGTSITNLSAFILCLIALLTPHRHFGAEFAILNFDANGLVTWTSPTNNAVYAIEYAPSPTGVWRRTCFSTTNDFSAFSDVLTNRTTAWEDTNWWRIRSNGFF